MKRLEVLSSQLTSNVSVWQHVPQVGNLRCYTQGPRLPSDGCWYLLYSLSTAAFVLHSWPGHIR